MIFTQLYQTGLWFEKIILFVVGLCHRGRRWRNPNWSTTPRPRAPPLTSPCPSTTKVATNVRNDDLLDLLFILQCLLHIFSDLSVQYPKVNSLSLLIWTNTPWSLVANKAICYKEDAEYSIVDKDNAGCRLYSACCVVATEMLSR